MSDQYRKSNTSPSDQQTIFIVSGGVGASAEQVVHTVLAQFPPDVVRVVTLPNVRYVGQLKDAILRAQTHHGLIVYTLVDSTLHAEMEQLAAEAGVPIVDLMGELMDHIQQLTGQKPLQQPGLYRQLNKTYYDRVAAIEFTMAHDDGKDPTGWFQADLLLLGVSRSGKTPLSLYLSMLGWKIANMPLVPGLILPEELKRVEQQRRIGIKIDAGQLLLHRQERQRNLGAPGITDYTNPAKVEAELAYAQEVYLRLGCTVLDVTDKPIESSADELIRLMTKRFR